MDFGAKSRAKQDLAIQWGAAYRSGDRERANRLQSAFQVRWSDPAAPGLSLISTSMPSIVLRITHASQKKSYYCGPASGYMVVRYLHGKGYARRYDGSPAGQKGMANRNHMRTEINHKTDWGSGYFVRGVNRWNGDSYYVQVSRPRDLGAVFLYSIEGNKKPFAADTVEFAGKIHYNNHPRSRTIGHWIMGYGFRKSGDTGYFADPVGGSSAVSWSSKVSKTFTYGTYSFNARFLQSNGVAY